MKLAVVQSRTGLGIVIVALGAVGTVAAALFGPKNADDDRRLVVGPVVNVLPRSTVPVRSVCPEPESDDYYYSMRIIPLGREYAFRDWYPPSLRALGEPSLSCGKVDADESYRFLFVPSFHGTIVVRIDRTGSDVRLHTAMLSGPDGRVIAESADIKLQKNQWSDLLGRLAAAHFWESPATESDMGLDGIDWVIEGRRDDRYWVVRRHSPSRAFAAAGIRFLELAKMMKEAALELD